MTVTATRLQIWLAATRPRTLPAAVAPVLVGSALAWRDGKGDGAAAGLCLAFAVLVQIGTNFANDYYDFVNGADTAARVGPRSRRQRRADVEVVLEAEGSVAHVFLRPVFQTRPFLRRERARI